MIGRLKVSSADGTLIRVPDTPANRAAFGSVGTGDDSSPFPQLESAAADRCLHPCPARDAARPGLADKAAAGQKLLDTAMEQHPHLFTMDRIWLLDRNFPGTPRIARLIARTHVLIRLKSDIPLKPISPVLGDGSYIAELSGDGVTVTVRVIEYYADVEGQVVPEMFCLVTDLADWREHPAPELAALYKWRWDGSETALRETKSCLDGAWPSAGPMLRSESPDLVRQELAAWAAATEMTRGVARDAALAAVPARKGRRAGQPVQPREIPFTPRPRRHRRDPPREGRLHRPDQRTRQTAATVVDRNRHAPQQAKCPSTFAHASRADTATRIAGAARRHRQQARLTSGNGRSGQKPQENPTGRARGTRRTRHDKATQQPPGPGRLPQRQPKPAGPRPPTKHPDSGAVRH